MMIVHHQLRIVVRRILFAGMVALLALAVTGPVFAQNNPRDVVTTFLDAWDEGDYERMYSLIHPQSREQFAEPVFTARYTTVGERITLTGISYTVNGVQMQGESAAVSYDVTLQTNSFGLIEDPGRTMRLVNTPNGWRVAWSTMDIFDMLTDSAEVRPQSRTTPRATIYDRDGNPLAADGQRTVVIYSARERIANEDACINLLGEIMRASYNTLRARFDRFNPDTVFFLSEMPQDIYEANEGRLSSTCGVNNATPSQPLRVYYGGNAVTHVTGYIGQIPQAEVDTYIARGYSSGDLVGQMGVERAYQDTLGGRPERVLRIVESGGTVLRELGAAEGSPSTPVMLTVDRDLQLIVAQAMADAFNYAAPNWGGQGISPGGAAVVLDVNSGAILALTSYPLADPTVFNPASMTPDRGEFVAAIVNDTRRPLRNRATEEQYPTGSAFKIVTGLAALNEGLVNPDDIFDCQYYWNGSQYGDTISQRPDWRAGEQDEFPPTGEVTPAQALMASCNPFYYEYGARLYREIGEGALVDYARQLGMGRSYNFNGALPETAGSLPRPRGIEDAINSAIGQGDIGVTPLSMAVMTAAIANGGTVYNPYLVQQVGGMDGSAASFTAEPEIINRLDLRPGVMETVQEGMCGVVTNPDLGTAYIRFYNTNWVNPITYTACGKTGTAETARYPHAWFVAYAPAENPEIAVVVMVEQSREGSQVAAPIVRRILDDYFGQPRADFPWWWNGEPYTPVDRIDISGGQ